MKKILLLLLTVTLVLSCSSDDSTEGGGDLKLKSERTITDYVDEDGFRVNYEYYDEYFYGSNGFVEKIRNVKIHKDEIIETYEYLYYEGNKVVRRLYNDDSISYRERDERYIYENDMIIMSFYSIPGRSSEFRYYYDSSRNMIKKEHYVYYDGMGDDSFDAIIEYLYEYENGNVHTVKSSYEYSYEYDNKHIPTKNSFPEAFKKIRYQSKNNITKSMADNEEASEEYIYEYNSKGYPIKATYNDGNTTVLYEYY